MSQFQSSPDSKVGCNEDKETEPVHTVVSILTRLEGRVQQAPPSLAAVYYWFQSSPDSKVGCNAQWFNAYQKEQGFNPHPTRRSGATAHG